MSADCLYSWVLVFDWPVLQVAEQVCGPDGLLQPIQRRFNQDVVDHLRFDAAASGTGRQYHGASLSQVVDDCLVVVEAEITIELFDLLPKDVHRDSSDAHPEADLKKVPAVAI